MKNEGAPVAPVEVQDLADKDDVVSNRKLLREPALKARDELLEHRNRSEPAHPLESPEFVGAAHGESLRQILLAGAEYVHAEMPLCLE